MSVSQPSKVIYAVDVPEVRNFTATFQYNFFTPDESVSDTGGVPSAFLQRNSDAVDAAFIQYAVTRAPRYVTFTFKRPKITLQGNVVDDQAMRDAVFSSRAQNGSLIADNIDKVVNEDNLATHGFAAASFHDGEIDDKVHFMVSGSYASFMTTHPADQNVSRYKAAQRFRTLTKGQIKPHFLFRALASQARSSGTRFFDAQGKRVFDAYFKRMKGVMTNVQVNGKLFHDIANRTIKDPQSPFTTDLHSIHKFSKKLMAKATTRASLQLTESDFKTFIPFIDLKVRNTAHNHSHRGPEIVGYIIDKTEFTENGNIRACAPIIIDNPLIYSTADFKIKYNTQYAYDARAVALFTIPAIDDDTGDIAMVKALVTSRPSNRVYVRTVEHVAPPPPTDIGFTWNYERVNPLTQQTDSLTGKPVPDTGNAGSLLVHWTFPPNSQQDIKKFQVFRRNDVDHPFELIKMYDFDDSVLKLPYAEDPDPSLVEHITSPCTFFYDDDFMVGDGSRPSPRATGPDQRSNTHPGSSTYIYAIAAVDAHGQTSGYSAQFEVWFDQFKNALQKQVISHAGAPKQYPNLYLDGDAFVDTIRTSGPGSKQATLYFNPEYYYLYDDDNRLHRILATEQTGGSYTLQFINTDNMKSVTLGVSINDMIKAANTTISFPEVRFGNRRRPMVQKVPNT